MGLINLHRGVDPGTHKLRITAVEEKWGPSGYPYLLLQLEIVRGESKGQQFSDMISQSPQSRFRMEPFLDAIGAPAKGQMDSTELVGKYAWGEVAIDTSRTDKNGDTIKQPRVDKWLLPPDDDVEEEEESNDFSQGSIPELTEEEDESPFDSAEEVAAPANGKKKSKKEELTQISF